MAFSDLAAAGGHARDETAALAYFEELRAAAERARRAAGTVERSFRVAGRAVRLSFAGPAMVGPLTAALAHLETAAAPPDLVIHVWDSASTGVPAPAPPWRPDDHLARGFIRGFNGSRFSTANLPVMDGFSMLDHERGTAVHWDPSAARITLHERSFPLRVILAWWAARHGLQFAHAGAVGRPDGGVLISGAGGSGKSTAALACVGSDLAFVSDDHVLLGDEPIPTVHSLYCSAKLHWDHLERLPHLKRCVANGGQAGEDKALLFLDRAFPAQISAGFPVKAILVPRITGEHDTRVAPITGAAALAALAPSSMFLLPGEDAAAFRHLAGIARRVPAFELRSGSDLAQISGAVARLLAEL